jgi:putative inorganic carbon (hco3(-)) transporter
VKALKNNFVATDLLPVFLSLAFIALYFLNYFFDFDILIKSIAVFIIAFLFIFAVTRYRHFVLYSLAFLVPLSIPLKTAGGATIEAPSEIICVVLLLFFVTKLLTGKKISRAFLTHPVTVFILLDVTWLLITSLTSEMPLVSFKRLFIKVTYYTSFYYFYFELFKEDPKNIKKVFLIHCIAFLIPIFFALTFHSTLGFTTMGSQLAAAPFYNDHTMYGAALAFFLPFLLLFTWYSFPFKSFIYFPLLLIFLVAFFFSYSRAAWLSLMISLLAGVIIRFKINTSFLLIAVAFAASFLFANREKIYESVSSNKDKSHGNDVTMHFKSISNVNTDVSNLERVNRWKCALRMFTDKPLVGFGPGTYQFFYGRYQVRKEMTSISTFSGNKGHAHSEYLNYISETGLPGLLIFIGLIFVAFYIGIKLTRKLKDAEKTIAYVLVMALVTFFLHAAFNGFLESEKLAMPVFVALAGITCLDLKQRRSVN